jgi:hypothetical protein
MMQKWPDIGAVQEYWLDAWQRCIWASLMFPVRASRSSTRSRYRAAPHTAMPGGSEVSRFQIARHARMPGSTDGADPGRAVTFTRASPRPVRWSAQRRA